MERQPHQPNGGEHDRGVNSYDTDDPETQAHIENARIDAARERQRSHAKLERLVELGMTPDDAEALVEFQAAQPEMPTDDDHETAPEPRLSPRIYVTDLASHHRGITHGLWIDANQQPDELDADIAAMLDSSPTLPGLPWDTAWAVGATEDFAGLDLHGFTDTPLIAKLAKGVADFGPAYAVYVSLVGTDDHELMDKFEDLYIGSYESAEAWMREVADDLGWQKQRERITDPLLQPYVTLDYAAMAEDAARSWDAVTGIDGRLYVFMR